MHVLQACLDKYRSCGVPVALDDDEHHPLVMPNVQEHVWA